MAEADKASRRLIAKRVQFALQTEAERGEAEAAQTETEPVRRQTTVDVHAK
jgi:hypothetical protein